MLGGGSYMWVRNMCNRFGGTCDDRYNTGKGTRTYTGQEKDTAREISTRGRQSSTIFFVWAYGLSAYAPKYKTRGKPIMQSPEP